MQSESLDTDMGLGHLSFGLENDNNMTTDGALLSGLATVGVGSDTHSVDHNFSDSVMIASSGMEYNDFIPQTCMDGNMPLPPLSSDLFQSSSLSHVTPMLATQENLYGYSPRSQTPPSSGIGLQNVQPVTHHSITFPNSQSQATSSFPAGNRALHWGSTHNALESSSPTLYENSVQTTMSARNMMRPRLGSQVQHRQTIIARAINNNLRQPSMPQLNSNENASPITLRVPLAATITKGLQLRLVTAPINSTSQGSTANQQTTPSTTNVMLFRDKVTGKNFLVPTGATLSSNNALGGNPITTLSTEQKSIADSQLRKVEFDVNEFLNIPYKELEPEKQNSSVNQCCNIEIAKTKNGEQNSRNVTSKLDIEKCEKNKTTVDVCKTGLGNFSAPSESILHSVKTSDDATKNQVNSNNNQINASENSIEDFDYGSAKTGEDLIKMMSLAAKKNRNLGKEKVNTAPSFAYSDENSSEDDTEIPFVEDKLQNHVQPQESISQPQKETPNEIQEKTLDADNEDNYNLANADLMVNKEADKHVTCDAIELNPDRTKQPIGGAIMQTEKRIANIVPDSMKDFVRDIFEDEDALGKDCIRHIMDDTKGVPTSGVCFASNNLTDASLVKSEHIATRLRKTDAQKVIYVVANQIKPKVSRTVTEAHIKMNIGDEHCIRIDGNRRWKCELCPKMYSTKHNLVTHMLGHNGIKPFTCTLCSKSFKQPSHLNTHLLTHGSVKPHTCHTCHKSFTQASHLKRHQATHLDKKPFVCDVCHRGFTYPSELRAHAEKHIAGEGTTCNECGESFESPKSLKQHLSAVHWDTKQSLCCKECGKEFVYPSQLRDHMVKHSGKRPYICGECGMDFMKEHHLKSHEFTHTGLKPFQCNICDKTFNQKANLQRHSLIHEENKYKCEICDRTFAQPQVLKSHMGTHSGEKPFQCTVCGKRFSRRHNLKGHMALHDGAKKYVCFCGASFTLKGNLNRHRNLKHGLEECSAKDENFHQISSVMFDPDDIAAEAAAQILNEMSQAKRMQPISTAAMEPTSKISGEYPHFVKPEHDSSIDHDDDSLHKDDANTVDNLPKKKRKSVPRKTCAKNKTLNQAGDKNNFDADMILCDNPNTTYLELLGENKPSALTSQANVMNSSLISRSESDDSNLSPAKPRSARRKKSTVAKVASDACAAELEQDDVEQEWRRPATDDVTQEDASQQSQPTAPKVSNEILSEQNVAHDLTDVWRDLRRLKGDVQYPSNGAQVTTDTFVMEVDDEGRPKHPVTITSFPGTQQVAR